MKYVLCLIVFLLHCFVSSAQTGQEAVEYLEKVSDGQRDISEQLMRYISVSTHSNNPRKIESKRQKLLKVTEQYQSKVASMDSFNGDNDLKNAISTYYDLCYNSLSNEYKQILGLKERARTDYEMMKSLLEAEEAAADNFDTAHEMVETELKKFTDQHKINLIQGEEDPLSSMIKKSNEVTSYYNQVFLPMFKVNVQNTRLKEVLRISSPEEIEHQKQLVIQYAKESRSEVSNIEAFDGDNSLIENALKRIDYYEKEAVTIADTNIKYVSLSQTISEKEKALKATPQKDRTKEMVEEYNALVGQVNELTNELNDNVTQFNQISQQEVIQWQEIVEAFRRRHIPKYGLFEQES